MLRLDQDRHPLDGALIHTPGLAGVDEAGRGPLAGPLVVAAVILPDHFDCRGLGDSKTLSAPNREAQARRIKAGTSWSVIVVPVAEIDQYNILEATMRGMTRAVDGLAIIPSAVVVDGNRVPKGLADRAEAVVKADGQYAAVAAASILAKVTRDALMTELATQYPRYGFNRHFGYGTPEHLSALRTFGPTPYHRRSFAPVKALIGQACLELGG